MLFFGFFFFFFRGGGGGGTVVYLHRNHKGKLIVVIPTPIVVLLIFLPLARFLGPWLPCAALLGGPWVVTEGATQARLWGSEFRV